MNTRKSMIYAHLALAALFMPLLLMMPLTGASYILGFKGDQTKTEAFHITEKPPEEKAAQENFFRAQFAQQGIDYDFEYVRVSSGEYTFRPTSRVHYVATSDGDKLGFSRIEPTLLKRLIELHKGHGPVAMRWFEVAFGVALILVTLSGLWLAWTVQPYRKVTLISFGAGALIIIFCLFIA